MLFRVTTRVLLLSLVVFAAACGDDDQPSPDAGEQPGGDPPLLSVPGAIHAECTGPMTRVVFTARATDPSDPAPSITTVPPAGSEFAIGTTEVRATAVNSSRAEATATFMVEVKDTKPPRIG